MENGSNEKVKPDHLKRNAYLYVRQSSPRQVIENEESTRRQYALRDRALALGWPEEQVVVIDCDLGKSAASFQEREGFRRLVSEVSLGRAGVVMALEISRLARKFSEWSRLVELCALTDTILLEEGEIYDPSHPADEFVLGIKGIMSREEWRLIRARLQGGLRSKAERGELKVRLPVGFSYDPRDRVVLTADMQVQESIRLLFSTFERVGSAHAVVRAFADQGLKFPLLLHYGPSKGEIVWRKLSRNRLIEVLHNPRYAGVFAFGRRTEKYNPAQGKMKVLHLPREKWWAFLPGAHEGYISLERFEENQRRLAENAVGRWKCPPREGPALLQGLAICGRCGGRMSVRYHNRRGGLKPDYLCGGPERRHGAKWCQSIPGDGIDEAVGKLLVELMAPVQLDIALSVQKELEARAEEVNRLRYRQVERARYEADLSRRRYMQADPDNRLVADELEAEWNASLRALREAKEEYDRVCQEDRLRLDAEKESKVRALAADFPALWQNPKTPAREKKRMVRLLIEDVTLIKAEEITMHVRFKGGATRTLVLPRLLSGFEERRTPCEIVEEIDRLLEEHTCGEIAEILNSRGLTSGAGNRFDGRRVNVTRKLYKLDSREARLRRRGFIRLKEVAERLCISKWTVKERRAEGRLPVRSCKLNDMGEYMYEDPEQK